MSGTMKHPKTHNSVPVKPELIRWARERAQKSLDQFASSQFKSLEAWEAGTKSPTLKQLEAFAKAVYVPMGYLFLSKPPREELPIPDFRTMDGDTVYRPSANLLDTLYACQERQDWYRTFLQTTGQTKLDFIGSSTLDSDPKKAACDIRKRLSLEEAVGTTWEKKLNDMIARAESAGILVMVNSLVAHNTSRKLIPQEFRGFSLSDPFAPLVFINGADAKAAQMFTFAHELAHVWLGASALSNGGTLPAQEASRQEKWCNAVAAEVLVPADKLKEAIKEGMDLDDLIKYLQKIFKVSYLVLLRRLLDIAYIGRPRFDDAWKQYFARLQNFAQKKQEVLRVFIAQHCRASVVTLLAP